jgi:hypothetical protein
MSIPVKEKFSKILIVFFLPLWIGLDVNMKHFWMNTFFYGPYDFIQGWCILGGQGDNVLERLNFS